MSKNKDTKRSPDSNHIISEDEKLDSTEALLSAFRETVTGSTSKQKLFETVQVRAAKGRRQTLIGIAAMVISLFCFLWLFSQGERGWGTSILLFWVVASGTYVWWSVRNVSRFSGLSDNSSKDLLHSWRNDLAREIKLIQVVGVIIALEIVYTMTSLTSKGFASENAIILLCLNAILAVGVIYAFVIELPSLRKEQKLLDGDV